MKRYNSLYYFLIVLLTMGAFASMAQNGYGLKILGAVSIAFGMLFFIQLLYRLRNNSPENTEAIIELSALTLFSILFPLRLFYISFPYMEWLLGAAGIILSFVYLQRMIKRFTIFKFKNNYLALLFLVFYGSIILFTIAMVTVSFIPRVAMFTGIAAFILLIIFLSAALLKRKFEVDGENVSAFSVIAHFKDQSLLLISLFFIFFLYYGFTGIGTLPRIYSDEYPQAYFELVNKAETGKETPVNGNYKHEEFKEKYDRFVKNNMAKDVE